MINQPNPQPISASLKPPRKRNIFSWLRIGCFLLLLMACGLWAAVSWWRNYQQEQHYQAGHEAYLNADCPTAIENFDKALAIDSLQIASLERALCESYLKPVESHAQGRWVEALLGYSEFVATRQSEPLEDGARRQVAALFAEAGAAALAEDTVCKEVDRLMAQELIPEPAANLPPLYLAC